MKDLKKWVIFYLIIIFLIFIDLDANIAREQQARTAERVMFLVDSLKVDQDESSLITRCSDLV